MAKIALAMTRSHRRVAGVIAFLLVLSGCASDAVKRAPATPNQPWEQPRSESQGVIDSFSVVDTGKPEQSSGLAPIVSDRPYTLPQLIDLAQQQNPDTRLAWQQARQAALAVGLAESVFLPIISASVVGGYQHTRTPLKYPIANQKNLETNSHAVVPALVLQWLLFDFGQRRAVLKGAEHLSFAANIGFNGVHQKIIFQVTESYYQYGAAQAKRIKTQEMLSNSQKILEAVLARRKQGVATSVEVAQAQQLVAQAELNQVLATNFERNTKQMLYGALGIPANSRLTVDFPVFNVNALKLDAPSEQVIEQALAERPDVLASYELAQAAKEGIRAAEANYMPKIFVSGALATGHGSFDIQGAPSIGQQTSSSSILIGVTLPLYDGGMRSIRLQEAKSRAESADETFKKTRDTAAREIVIAADALRSAAAANKAADRLVKTAEVTYDAAFNAYQHGVGTVTLANEAANGLLTAQQMDIDARTSVLVAAANLAFVMGEITQFSAP